MHGQSCVFKFRARTLLSGFKADHRLRTGLPIKKEYGPLLSGLALSFILYLNLPAQFLVDSTLAGQTIRAIEIRGNEKTRASVILREMEHRVGDPLDINRMEEDRKRIQNLNLFNRVVILTEHDTVQNGVMVQVWVTESWYIFPYPILFIHDRDWDKFSYGAGLVHLNFRGRAETLAASFWLGYDPSIQLEYDNPWIGGSRNLSVRFVGYYSRIRSKHFQDVNENHTGLKGTLGKRFGLFTYLSLSMGYKEVTFSPPVSGQTLLSGGRDRLPNLGLLFVRDTRDLKEYPHSGWYFSLSAIQTGFPALVVNYLRTGLTLKQFTPVGNCTIAMKLALNLSGGKIPVYDRIYLGYGDRVRGHFYETREGEEGFLAGLAFRFPLLPVRYFDLGSIHQLKNLKFGISAGFFADTGTVWYQNEKPSLGSMLSGFGAGLHIHLPYINLLRIELAFDEQGHEQWIADLYVDI